MTWAEAQQAFRDQVPVIYENRTISRGTITCPRIAEITLYRNSKGEILRIVGAMDRNENCIYRDTPDKFTRRVL